MLRTLVERFAKLLSPPRIIWNREGTVQYLSRYYLLGRPTMADGSDPFDRFGNPKEEAIWSKLPFGVYLHHFHRSDDAGALHNHPWKWALGIIMVGGYSEEKRVSIFGCGPTYPQTERHKVERLDHKPGSFNLLKHDTFHRVDLIEHDAWSLFITGKKDSSWGFWDRHTDRFTPWREYINQKRAS